MEFGKGQLCKEEEKITERMLSHEFIEITLNKKSYLEKVNPIRGTCAFQSTPPTLNSLNNGKDIT